MSQWPDLVAYRPEASPSSMDVIAETLAVVEVVTCGQTFVYQLEFAIGKCPCLNGGVCSTDKESRRQCRCPNLFIGKPRFCMS